MVRRTFLNDTSKYSSWCVGRIFTSKKIIGEQSTKLASLEAQLISCEFPTWVRNKYKNLCPEAMNIQCKHFTNTATNACKVKLAKAEATMDTAYSDSDDLLKALSKNADTRPAVEPVKDAFRKLFASRLAGSTAKAMLAEKQKKAGAAAAAIPTDVSTAPPSTEEIGSLIKKDVRTQVKMEVKQKKTNPTKKVKKSKNKNGARKTKPGEKGNANARRRARKH